MAKYITGILWTQTPSSHLADADLQLQMTEDTAADIPAAQALAKAALLAAQPNGYTIRNIASLIETA